MFDEVSGLLHAVDLAICHLETPISSDNKDLTGYPLFNAPRELAGDLVAVGYDGCSTASNHSMDRRASGVISTINQLESAGLKWSGMARTESEGVVPTIYQANGIKIAHLSYTYGLNGFTLPVNQPYLVNEIDLTEILVEARHARGLGADFIIVSLQWGNEYQSEPSKEQKELAEVLLNDPDVDLIVGTHVHVVQPIGTFNGKPVIYGLGNFLSNQSANCCPEESQNGVMAFIEISGHKGEAHRVTEISVIPTRVNRADFTIVVLPEALKNTELSNYVRSVYLAAMENTLAVINAIDDIYQLEDQLGQ